MVYNVSVVIPALNEENTIAGVVQSFIVSGCADEIIVCVDPKTTDATAENAFKAGARVLFSVASGYANVVKHAVNNATYDLIFKSDGDVTNPDPCWLPNCLAKYDTNVGIVKSFWDDSDCPRYMTKFTVKPLLNRIKPELNDINLPISGFYLFNRKILRMDQLPDDWSIDIEMLFLCLEKKLVIEQAEITSIDDGDRPMNYYERMAQQIVDNILNHMLDIRKKQILFITAHCDDAEIWCGGIIAKYCSMGYQINNIILTSTSDRESEARSAINQLQGYTVDFFGLSEFSDFATEENVFKLVSMIRKIEPDIIITHYSDDFHKDHRNTTVLVHSALLFLDEEPYPSKVYYMNSYSGIDNYSNKINGETYVDTSDFFETKCSLINAFKSQRCEHYIKMCQLMDGLNGFRVGKKYAEVLKKSNLKQCNSPTEL